MKKKKIIIIGGGFGGLSCAKGLINSNYEVLIIDKKNHHLFQPLLYQVATASLSPGDIAVPIREVFSKAKNVKVIMDEVTSIDKTQNAVLCNRGNVYHYDNLILAPGSTPNYFNNPGFEKYAPGLKNLEDALNIRVKVLRAFERCEQLNKEELNIVIIGAGPTGVELAGAFAEISHKILVDHYKDFDLVKTKIYLIEGGGRVLSSYSEKLSKKSEMFLKEMGVTIIKNKLVDKIDEKGIYIDNQLIESQNIIWAAGNIASPLLTTLNVPLNKSGQIKVEQDLSIPGYSNIFVIGDSAEFLQDDIKLPALAPVAAQQGKFLAKKIKTKRNLKFKYFDKGSMATIGSFKAIIEYKRFQLSGMLAWLGWGLVHILFLINFRNKIVVFWHWVLNFIFNRKGVMIITDMMTENQSRD